MARCCWSRYPAYLISVSTDLSSLRISDDVSLSKNPVISSRRTAASSSTVISGRCSIAGSVRGGGRAAVQADDKVVSLLRIGGVFISVYDPLARRFFVPRRPIDLPGKKQSRNLFRFQRAIRFRGIDRVVLNRVPR